MEKNNVLDKNHISLGNRYVIIITLQFSFFVLFHSDASLNYMLILLKHQPKTYIEINVNFINM